MPAADTGEGHETTTAATVARPATPVVVAVDLVDDPAPVTADRAPLPAASPVATERPLPDATADARLPVPSPGWTADRRAPAAMHGPGAAEPARSPEPVGDVAGPSLARPQPGEVDGPSRAVLPEPTPAMPAPSWVPGRPTGPPTTADGGIVDGRAGCTAAQLRRFIKSRAYVPLHELRRRFELDGGEDDVSPIESGGRRLYVGLPAREARLLAELLEAGDVGCELLLDPSAPLVVGVFPMRPVPRA